MKTFKKHLATTTQSTAKLVKSTKSKAEPKKVTVKNTMPSTKKNASKVPVKKAVAKASAQKVAPVKKVVAKKVTAKTVAKKPVTKAPAKKVVAKKVVPIKKTVAKASAQKVAPVPNKVEIKVAPVTEGKLTKVELEKFRHDLLELRERVCAKVDTALQNVRHHNEAETGTEIGANVFDKFLALERAGNTKDLLTRIDEALARMNEGSYGLCLMCGRPIRRVRLEVQPFSKHCIKCQEELEKFMKIKQ